MSSDSEVRYGREFGKGAFLGEQSRGFFDKPIGQQVREMGWSHACPVIDDVVSDFGEEWTLQRYGECNFVFGLITEIAGDLNPPLFNQLTSYVDRLPDEPPGILNDHTPASHKIKMAPLSTPWGYALPRIAIEQMGRGKDHEDRTPERFFAALELIEEAVRESGNPIELVVNLSEKVCAKDADPKEVLSHLLPEGVMTEENTRTMFTETVNYMRKRAPILTAVYDAMPPGERSQLGILSL